MQHWCIAVELGYMREHKRVIVNEICSAIAIETLFIHINNNNLK